MSTTKKYEAIVIGVSSGGMKAMKTILPALPQPFLLPIIIVQHISPHSDSTWINILNKECSIAVKEADEKEEIVSNTIYFAPPNYHLLIERDKTFSLSIDERVNYARPSIDVLFESASDAYKDNLIGIILTGSNHDGSEGLKKIKMYGGLAIVEDPNTAESAYMPSSAIERTSIDYILPLNGIIKLLIEINTTINNP